MDFMEACESQTYGADDLHASGVFRAFFASPSVTDRHTTVTAALNPNLPAGKVRIHPRKKPVWVWVFACENYFA